MALARELLAAKVRGAAEGCHADGCISDCHLPMLERGEQLEVNNVEGPMYACRWHTVENLSVLHRRWT